MEFKNSQNKGEAERNVLAVFLEALLESNSKQDALKKSLQKIVTLGWLPLKPIGGVFLVSKNTPDELELFVTTDNFSSVLLKLCNKVRYGHCICGKAALSKEIVFVDCVDESHNTTFDDMTPHGHYSVPFFNSKQNLQGVLVLYLEHGHKSSASELEFLGLVAYGLGAVVERFDREEKYHRQKDSIISQKSSDLLRQKRSLNVAALVCETDLTGKISYVNDKFCEKSGYRREELLGQTHKLINSGIHSADFWQACWSTIQNGQVWKNEVCNRSKNSNLYWVDANIFQIINKNNVAVGYSSVDIDITEKKASERQLQHSLKLASIGEMAAGVGHEINNPLAVGIGNISIIELILKDQNQVDPLIYEKLDKIKNAHSRIRKIVDGLRTYARSDTDHNEIISMQKALEQTLNLVSELYATEGIAITKECPDKKLFTRGSMGKMQQIIMNLISNAKDATVDRNQREIHLAIRQGENETVSLSVTDNGTGIADDIREKITSPFFTTKPAGVGTGIGLGLVCNFVKKMQGKLHIESKLGMGSTFTVILPSVEGIVLQSNQSKCLEELKITDNSLQGRILIVDDEADIRDLLVQYLTRLGLETDQADDGDAALEKLKNCDYDYICTDMKMPRMRGEIFIEEARKIVGAKTKFVIITGGVTTNYSEKQRKDLWQLADGYITKPFTPEILYQTIISLDEGNAIVASGTDRVLKINS